MSATQEKLTGKQEAFVREYLLNNGNATAAAIHAGYSEKTAKVIGAENLTKPNIASRIKEHQKESKKDFIWSKEKKLEMLQSVITNAATVCEDDGFNKGKMHNHSAVISAIKEHNLMMGDNAPTETNTNLNVAASLAEKLTGGSKR